MAYLYVCGLTWKRPRYLGTLFYHLIWCSSVDKESVFNARDPGLIPGSGRSAGEGIGYPLQYSWASLVAQLVKNLPAMLETWVQSLGWEDTLEKGKATHSSSLAWRIPWIIVYGVTKSQTWLSDFHSLHSLTQRSFNSNTYKSIYIFDSPLGSHWRDVLKFVLLVPNWCLFNLITMVNNAYYCRPMEYIFSGIYIYIHS